MQIVSNQDNSRPADDWLKATILEALEAGWLARDKGFTLEQTLDMMRDRWSGQGELFASGARQENK